MQKRLTLHNLLWLHDHWKEFRTFLDQLSECIFNGFPERRVNLRFHTHCRRCRLLDITQDCLQLESRLGSPDIA